MVTDIQKVPPNNGEAERAVLASLLLENPAIDRVAAIIQVEDFYQGGHKLIFEKILDLRARREPVDIVTVSNELGAALPDVGGQGYLVDLVGSIPTTAHADYYAQIVADKARMRQLLAVSYATIAAIRADESSAASILEDAEKAVTAIAHKRRSGGLTHIGEVIVSSMQKIEAQYDKKETAAGTPTGFYDLDYILNGFQPSDLLILAARPAMGKTSFSLNLARNVGVDSKKPALIFSLEMSKEQLVQRMLCAEAGIDSHRLRTGYLSENDWRKLSDAIEVLASSPIYIDDTAVLTVGELGSKCRRHLAELGEDAELGLVMVDYLQLMETTGSKREENRATAMGAISRGLKQLARELRCPLVALSQLSRAVESRPNKRPMLSDLRDSGTIEQDSDIVMFIYRDEYYNPDTEKKATAEVIVAKHRNGPVGTIELYFEKSQTKFTSIEHSTPTSMPMNDYANLGGSNAHDDVY